MHMRIIENCKILNCCSILVDCVLNYDSFSIFFQPAFEIIGLISVITNCAVIGMDPGVKKLLPSDLSAVNYVLIFVAAEVNLKRYTTTTKND